MPDEPDLSRRSFAARQGSIAEAEIAISLQSSKWRTQGLDTEFLCRQAVSGALAAVGSDDEMLEISVVLADDALVRRLNRENRGHDRPANVLAFPGEPHGEILPDGAPRLLGDVVLAHETVSREACRLDKPFEDHLRHLVVHGALHLLGYGHDTESEAQAMESLETTVLAEMGVPDPYSGENAGADGPV